LEQRVYIRTKENLTGNFIEFRMAVTCPRDFSAGDEGATVRTWGLANGEFCHQYLGSVNTRTGLGIVFPNIYQHRHTSLRLLDPSKEGHQTVVAFFLIDPEIQPITSTSSVGPQQEEWIREAVNEAVDMRVPGEIVEQIVDNVEGLMSVKDAENFREQMRKERSGFWRLNDACQFCIPFDVWRNGTQS
jgi:Protein of unknown function (DUF4246)